MDPHCQRILWRRAPLSITNCAVSGREANFLLADVKIESANIDLLALRRIGVSTRAIGNVHTVKPPLERTHFKGKPQLKA